jgi:hypothetical protein
MCIRCTDKIYMGGKEKVRNPTRGVFLYCVFDMLCKKCYGGGYRLCKTVCIERLGLLLWLQGGWGVPPLTEKFCCDPPASLRNAGTVCVVSALCFALLCCCLVLVLLFRFCRCF